MLAITAKIRATRKLGPIASLPTAMGKKKLSGYNDFLDGEKLRDNAEVRYSLNATSSTATNVPVASTSPTQKGGKKPGQRKSKPPLTHFLCLPLITDTSKPQLQSGLNKLKQDMQKDKTIPTTAIRPLGTLHLTLGVMSLTNPQHLQAAKQYLQTLNLNTLLHNTTPHQKAAKHPAENPSVSKNLSATTTTTTTIQPDIPTINLHALTPMQSPAKTSILYATPRDPTDRLVAFATALHKDLMQRGFVVDENRPLKLHATIVNTVHAKSKNVRMDDSSANGNCQSTADDSVTGNLVAPGASLVDGYGSGGEVAGNNNNNNNNRGHGSRGKGWMRFDARDLIDRYKDFIWAEDVRIDRVQICKMGAKKLWSSGQEGQGEIVDERYEVVFERGFYE